MENEIWKDVVGYEGLYQVSNLGAIRSLIRGKILRQSLNTMGYYSVSLCLRGTILTKTIHPLVAKAFIDENYKSKGLVVNHINFKRDDNRLENLELVTIRENSNRKHIKSTSKYVGVHWDKRIKRWVAQIVFLGRQKRLGIFENEEEASVYYEAALICIQESRFRDIKVKKYNNRARYKGVYFIKEKNKWRYSVTISGKTKCIGYSPTEDLAFEALQKYKSNRYG